MGKLSIEQYVVGQVQTNCYFAINTDTKELLIVDPGDCAKQLIEKVEKAQYKPAAVLLTHGHFDHAGAAKEVAEHFGIKIYCHEAEKETLETASLNLSGWAGKATVYHADELLRDEQELDLAGFHIRVLHTPGHTIGGCCYYLPYEDVIFSGDSLFCMSIGRTDFPKGSSSQLIRAIKEKLMILPETTVVYPGHNEVTTIEQERMYNPYL